MRFFRKIAVLLVLVLVVSGSSIINISASEEEAGNGTHIDEFKLQYSELTVPDRLITLTKDLNVANIAWSDAGVVKASDAKKDYEQRGVLSAYCDPDTKEIVYFISNSNEETLNKFSFAGMSDDEIITYAKTLINLDNIEGAKAEWGIYSGHPQVKFFTLVLTNELMAGEELIYGTIVNGMILQFTTDSINTGRLNAEFVEELVQNLYITSILTYDEYMTSVKNSMIKLGLIFGGLILLIVILVLLSKMSAKNKKKRNSLLADQMLVFRKKRQSGNVKMGEPLITSETVYSNETIDNFSTYNTWIFRGYKFYPLVLLYLCLLWLVFNTGSTILMILGIAVGVGLLYYKYSKSEKAKDIMKKQLKTKDKPTALFRFYEEFFTVSGLDSISEYIYPQITAVKGYKNYMFIYMSEQHALILDLNKLPSEKDEELMRLLSGKF